MKKLLSYLFALAAVAFAFTSCEDVPMPYDYPNSGNNSENVDPNAKGQSADNPYTVQEAVQLIKDGKAPTTEVYVKGVVSKVDYYSEDYHSLSYYLSDDGKTEDLQVYSGKGLNGADVNSKSDLKVGQTVIVKGVIKSFDKKGTTIYEVDKNSQIVSIEGSGETPSTGDTGLSKDNPLTPSEALDIAKALGKGNTSTESYYIKGKISSIKFSFDAEHGTATFNISADGSKEFTCYSVYYFGNKSWVEGNTQVNVGDEVVVYGKLTNFKGTPETAAKKACLYSLNGKTE